MQKHVLTVCSADEVSGCTILSDGTKVYWGEGRSSSMIVIGPDGTRTEVPVYEQSPMMELMEKLAEQGYEPQRAMTDAEEAEFEAATGCHREF